MIILAIDTSCDDTCVAVLKVSGKKRPTFKVLSNIISSQTKIHRKYGGVWPFLAKREHQKNLPIVFGRAKKKARVKKFDLISVTIGPGLEPCLWVGVNFAKNLSKKLEIPIIPINHIEAHIYANLVDGQKKFFRFPAVCLVVSGGHTQLILMKNHLKYKILGETRDDAAGECFDKVARILGLKYPGGPEIEREAKKLKVKKFKVKLPRPMIFQKNYDFSFSGLKTAVLYDFKNRPKKIKQSRTYIREIAKETQQSIIDVLIYKTLKAAKDYKAKTIILGGGVTANKELRKQFKKNIRSQALNIKFFVPEKEYCTDNGAMIGVASYFHYLNNEKYKWKKIKADANLKI